MIQEVDSDNLVLVRDFNQGARKRQKNVTRREVAKGQRYCKPSGSNLFTPCNHKNNKLQCCKIRPADALQFRNNLYITNDKQKQDQIVSRLIHCSQVKRPRPRPQRPAPIGLGLPQPKPFKPKPHSVSTTYTFPTIKGLEISVCKTFFLHLTKFSADRVRYILKQVKLGKPICENRGGDHVSHKSLQKKNAVREFIGNLRGTESHYNRKKSKRIYLHCSLNIRKLHTIYNSSTQPNLKVSLSMFRRIFLQEFNIGFRSPASDVCGFCTMLNNKLKAAQGSEKQAIITEKRIHKLRAKCFYELLKEKKEDELSLCFDMQQVQPLPRTPIQQAFYARQFGLYNVCIVDVQNTQPTFFMWTEEQAGRGSAVISSALLSYLNACDFTGKNRLKLFCDGCSGQNKNNNVLHALMHFLATHEGPLKQITLTFPVRGHSFLPCDRVFGRVERLLRKKPTIIEKNEYYEEYGKVGIVKLLGTDWALFDIKELGKSLKNLDMISEKKRIIIDRKVSRGKVGITVFGNEFYRFEAEGMKKYTLLKKGISWVNILNKPLQELPLVNHISADKKKDVDQLLTILFEKDWKNDEKLVWYTKIITECPTSETTNEEVFCECLEDDNAIHV